MIRQKHILLYLVISTIALGIYLLWSGVLYRPGFPLDDAWIHQTYARNLALNGTWTFQEGLPSAGSTAPLWTALLSIGHMLQLMPLAWNFILGVLTLTGLAIVAARGIEYFAPEKQIFARIFGGLLIFEWHVVWAAGSGMETLLFAVVSIYVLVSLLREDLGPLWLGIWVGLAVWLRPDGITLLGPVFFTIALRQTDLRKKLRDGSLAIVGLLVFIVPYLAFNSWLSGEVLPSTFFAKQAEYAVLRSQPLISRLAGQLLIPVVGAGVVAVPGLLPGIRGAIVKRKWPILAGLAWFVGMALLYAIRLPVTYQHGRYLIPVIPVLLIWGTGPVISQLKLQTDKFWPRVLSRSWLLLIVATLFVFYIVGGRAFAWDVAVIESEMVDTAEWVRDNISSEPEVRIAAHDIGALGYFGQVPLVDMAGLVSPAAISIIRNEQALAEYINDENVSYLITLEGWYPVLEEGLEVRHRTNAKFSPSIGGPNMIVYVFRK